MTQTIYDQIKWKHQGLKDLAEWEKQLDTVKLLCAVGTPIKVTDNDYADNIPSKYCIEGLVVEFLPHWKSCKVKNNYFSPPKSEEILQQYISVSK